MRRHHRRISCFGWCVILMLAVIIALWGRIFMLEFVLPDRQNPRCSFVTAPYYRFTGGFTNAGRLDFIAQFGWEVDANPIERERIAIPKHFDTIWLEYNALQQRVGLDLRKYAGKHVTRHTYQLRNHPSGDAHARVNLLVYGNKIVAADVSSPALDGFMHSITERK